MAIKDKTDYLRYLAILYEFPDGETFVQQKEFIHSLQFEAKNWVHTVFHDLDNPKAMADLLITKGECRTQSNTPFGAMTRWYRILDKPLKLDAETEIQ